LARSYEMRLYTQKKRADAVYISAPAVEQNLLTAVAERPIRPQYDGGRIYAVNA